MAAVREPTATTGGRMAFHIGSQNADLINNVSGDQWNYPAASPSGSDGDGRSSPHPSHLADVGVFISYRHEDTEGHAGRVRDWLVRRFGEERVFQDVDGIDPGEDFVDRLEQELGKCDVLLAIIGRQWLTCSNDLGSRMIDDPRDWVRLEIQVALDRGVPVIPVLVGGARMPSETALPKPLGPLGRRNAIEMGPQWAADVERLGEAIERAAGRGRLDR